MLRRTGKGVGALPDNLGVVVVGTVAILAVYCWLRSRQRAPDKSGTATGTTRAIAKPQLGEDGGAAVWVNPGFGSFDDFGQAMLLLYVMSTGDEWEAQMYVMMDSTGPGKAPVRDSCGARAFDSIGVPPSRFAGRRDVGADADRRAVPRGRGSRCC